VILMGNLTMRALSYARLALANLDRPRCSTVVTDDEEIDLLEKEVDRQSVCILLRFQPVASDLRRVVTSSKIGLHLERVSDETVVIARQILSLPAAIELPERHLVQPVLESNEAALNRALNLFLEFDSIRVGETLAWLEFLAGRAREAANALSDLLEIPRQPIRPLLNLIEIAHSAERMAPQISNILEETVYLAGGVDRRHAGNRLA
jgi:phosphate transport system protein